MSWGGLRVREFTEGEIYKPDTLVFGLKKISLLFDIFVSFKFRAIVRERKKERIEGVENLESGIAFNSRHRLDLFISVGASDFGRKLN